MAFFVASLASLGFSFAPGGLLLPYHLGAIEALNSAGLVTSSTPLAGSSAGAIAIASFAAGVPPRDALMVSASNLSVVTSHVAV
jgi:predicted acylesterase/phospholipase RssA